MSDAKAPPAPAPQAKSPPSRPAEPSRPPLVRVVEFLASYGLATVVLVLLMFLVLFGTLAQSHMSLYDVQREYFEAFVVLLDVGGVPVPFPGAALLIAVLCVNLTLGGVIRMRRGKATAGVLIAHVGILLLFVGGLVEWMWSDKGQMTLREGDASDEFSSYTDWEVAVRERHPAGSAREFVVPHKVLRGIEDGGALRVAAKDLPFDLRLSGWVRNGVPKQASRPDQGAEGWTVDERVPEKEAERNEPAVYASVLRKDGTSSATALLWGGERFPYATKVDGKVYEVELRRTRWTVPFRLRLDKFEKEDYAGIRMAKRFSSFVTMSETGVDRKVHITMNEPLRHKGYTFYQSSWGPEGAPPGTPLFSTFSVVRNPSDQVPLIACLVIFAGMLVHFGRKLYLHILASSAQRAAQEAAR